MNLPWDFSAYILNAKYIFYDGIYFEVYRSPLPSLLFGFFLLFKGLANPLYIIFVSCLFLYSNVSLANTAFEKSKIEKRYIQFFFYFFSLSFFALHYSLSAGTELLSLAFFELFLAFLIRGKISGHFLGLAILSRYTFIPYSIFLIFNKNYKKILLNLLTFLAVLFPWFLFNYIKFGNWFASIIDSYAMNIFYRDYLIQQLNPLILIKAIGIFLPFLILGLVVSTISFLKQKKKFSKSNLILLLFALISITIILDFNSIPLKIERYLFNLTLPIAFFSTMGSLFLIRKIKNLKKPLVIIFLIISITSIFILSFESYQKRHWDDSFYSAAEDIKILDLQDCKIISPHWVPIHYLTGNAYPLKEDPYGSIQKNEILLIFKNISSLDHSFTSESLEQFPALHETDKYIFLAKENLTKNNCAKTYVSDQTYTTKHCEILASKFSKFHLEKTALNTCNAINRI